MLICCRNYMKTAEKKLLLEKRDNYNMLCNFLCLFLFRNYMTLFRDYSCLRDLS